MDTHEIKTITPATEEHLAMENVGVILANNNTLSHDDIMALVHEAHALPKPAVEKIGAIAGLKTGKKDFIKPGSPVLR